MRTAESWTIRCFKQNGFEVSLDADGGFNGVSYASGPPGPTGSPPSQTEARMDVIGDQCYDLSDAVSAAYVYDHASFWSWSTPLPGIGRALRELRS